MLENLNFRPASVIGPLGETLALESLPSPETRRWAIRRKAQVVAAVQDGLPSFDEVCERYSLYQPALIMTHGPICGVRLS